MYIKALSFLLRGAESLRSQQYLNIKVFIPSKSQQI